jgi:hypothetical protein
MSTRSSSPDARLSANDEIDSDDEQHDNAPWQHVALCEGGTESPRSVSVPVARASWPLVPRGSVFTSIRRFSLGGSGEPHRARTPPPLCSWQRPTLSDECVLYNDRYGDRYPQQSLKPRTFSCVVLMLDLRSSPRVGSNFDLPHGADLDGAVRAISLCVSHAPVYVVEAQPGLSSEADGLLWPLS